ncbi:MAG: hypothetical protein ACOYBY_17800 [Dermatophilaceae bacterium]
MGVGGGALVAWLALQNSTGVTLQGAGVSVAVLPITLFCTGALAVVLLWVGWRVLVIGVRRRRAQREEIKALRSTSAEAERNRTGADTSSAATVTPATTTHSPTASSAATEAPPPSPETGEVASSRVGERPIRGPMD